MERGAGSGNLFRFGLFEADPACCTPTGNGARVKIQDQPFRLLFLLLEWPGELRQVLWPEGMSAKHLPVGSSRLPCESASCYNLRISKGLVSHLPFTSSSFDVNLVPRYFRHTTARRTPGRRQEMNQALSPVCPSDDANKWPG